MGVGEGALRSVEVSLGIEEHKKSCKEMVLEDHEIFVEGLSGPQRIEWMTQK